MKVFPQKSALALSAVLAAGLLSTVIDGAWAQTVIT